MSTQLKSIAIIGSGLNAWAAAARLGKALSGQGIAITVIDPSQNLEPEIVSLSIRAHAFHSALGVREIDLVKNLGASYKYGVRYLDSISDLDSLYCYSPTGEMFNRVPFHHHVSRLRSLGEKIDHELYSLACIAARSDKFSHPEIGTLLENIDYALSIADWCKGGFCLAE